MIKSSMDMKRMAEAMTAIAIIACGIFVATYKNNAAAEGWVTCPRQPNQSTGLCPQGCNIVKQEFCQTLPDRTKNCITIKRCILDRAPVRFSSAFGGERTNSAIGLGSSGDVSSGSRGGNAASGAGNSSVSGGSGVGAGNSGFNTSQRNTLMQAVQRIQMAGATRASVCSGEDINKCPTGCSWLPNPRPSCQLKAACVSPDGCDLKAATACKENKTDETCVQNNSEGKSDCKWMGGICSAPQNPAPYGNAVNAPAGGLSSFFQRAPSAAPAGGVNLGGGLSFGPSSLGGSTGSRSLGGVTGLGGTTFGPPKRKTPLCTCPTTGPDAVFCPSAGPGEKQTVCVPGCIYKEGNPKGGSMCGGWHCGDPNQIKIGLCENKK